MIRAWWRSRPVFLAEALAAGLLWTAAMSVLAWVEPPDQPAAKPPEAKRIESKARIPDPSESAAKYVWQIGPEKRKSLLGTHAVVVDGDCDLTPGWQCDLILDADGEGRVAVPVKWLRPAGDSLSTVLVSHEGGSGLVMQPDSVTVAGFAPEAKVGVRVALWTYPAVAGQNPNARSVRRGDAGLADCMDVCLLAFGRFVELHGPAPAPADAPEPVAASWLATHWPAGWRTVAPSIALLLSSLLWRAGRLGWRVVRIAAGHPPPMLALPV